MSNIHRFMNLAHLSAEPTSHVMRYRKGHLVTSAPAATFWFRPINAAIAEVPIMDNEQAVMFTGRTSDFQDVVVQGTITYRITDPERAAARIDFAIDTATGDYRNDPLQRLADMVSLTAQQLALDWVSHRTLAEALTNAVAELRPLLTEGLGADTAFAEAGVTIVTVRVTRVAPHPDLERALQAPTRERVQQAADEAAFQRRALAVDKERAIEENELNNKIELAKRTEHLIAQDGANARQKVAEATEVKRIEAVASAERRQLQADAEASAIAVVKNIENQVERERAEAMSTIPTNVLLAIALRDVANRLDHIDIDHLSINPSGMGAMLETLMGAGTKTLEAAAVVTGPGTDSGTEPR